MWRWRAAWCRSCPPRWSTTCPSVAGSAGRPPSSATPPPRAPEQRWRVGTVGAGAGARVGVLKGGVGTASVTLDSGVTVGAIVVVNAAGEVVDTDHRVAVAGRPDRGVRARSRRRADQIAAYAARHVEFSPLNTTIAVVATDAAMSPAGCRRVAVAAHDGLARTIRPCHTPLDGDTVFALATGAVEVPPDPETPASMSPEVPADHRGRGGRRRCAGPRGARRRACGRVGSRNTDLSGHVARSVRRSA